MPDLVFEQEKQAAEIILDQALRAKADRQAKHPDKKIPHWS